MCLLRYHFSLFMFCSVSSFFLRVFDFCVCFVGSDCYLLIVSLSFVVCVTVRQSDMKGSNFTKGLDLY